MKTSLQSSYDKMWKALHMELIRLAEEHHGHDAMGEVRFLTAYLIKAGTDHYTEYFVSDLFNKHCNCLGLHKKFVLSLFKRAWRIEKSGVVWEYTQPLDENYDD